MTARPFAEAFDRCVAQAQSAEAAGRLAEAAASIRDALALDPDARSLHNWLGWVLLASGERQEALDSALRVAPHDHVAYLGSLRLRAYLRLDAGDWRQADALVAETATIDGDAAAALGVELSERLLSLMTPATADRAGIRPRIAVGALPRFVLGPANSGGRAVVMRIAAAAAADLDYDGCLALLARPGPSDQFPITDCAGPLAETTIITSIAPHRLDVQRRAIASWQSYGATVVSVNTGEEIDRLRGRFPDVAFVPSLRDARSLFGKPYVYLDDMLRAAAGQTTRTIGIFNADVALDEGQQDEIARVTARSRHFLVLGHRLDVDDGTDRDSRARGVAYLVGFDWFLLDRASLGRIAAPGFAFGCPWWDLWLPIAALAAGLPITIDRNVRVYHERHETRWAEAAYHTLGRSCLRRLADLDSADVASPSVRLLASIAAGEASGILRDVEERPKLDWLAGLMRTLIVGESATVPPEG